MNISELLPHTRDAGVIALEIYRRDFDVALKDDKSPVTEADIAVDWMIVPAIEALFPDIPIVSEERANGHVSMDNQEMFFLVDPIDGTKEFINKTGEFTINVGLIKNGVPVAGIVYAPALERMFVAEADGRCYEQDSDGNHKELSVRDCAQAPMVAVASRSHNTPETQAFLDNNNIIDCVSAGSSLKFCVLAAGEADIYPRFGPTMEWDTAAGHAVLKGAGGNVFNTDFSAFKYGKAGFKNPSFIASTPHAAKRWAK